jgi:hypothetical protein
MGILKWAKQVSWSRCQMPIKEIVGIQLEGLKKRLSGRRLTLEVSEGAVQRSEDSFHKGDTVRSFSF